MRIKTILLIALLSFVFVVSQDTVNTDELYEDYPDTTENSTSNESTQDAKVDTSTNNESSNSNSSTNTSSSNQESNTTDMTSNDNNNIDNDDITWDDDTESEANTETSSASVETPQNNNLQTSTESENNSNTTSQENNISSNSDDNITFDDTNDENNSEVVSSSESTTKAESTTNVEANQTNENNSAINQENNDSSNIVNDDITWDDDTSDESNTETATKSNESTTKTESNVVQNNNETTNNSSQNLDDDEFSWETTDSEENLATEKVSREANNDKFLSEPKSLNTSTEVTIQNQNELNFEEPMAEESSETKKTSGLNVKCFWFNGHNETFDLSPLDNRTEDKKIEVTAKKNYFYNFCNPTVVKCNEGLNLMRLEKDDKCTIVAGNEGKTFSEFEKMTKKEIVDEKEKEIIVGLRVKLATGEKCASDETKTYQTTWEISCDEDKEAKKGVITVLNASDLDLDQPGRVDKCSLVVKAKSVHGCPLSNYYAVSAFMEANKIIFMIVIVVIGIFLTYLGSKILNITLMITAFFATVIGVFLIVFGIFGAYKISNGIMWLIFSITILLAGGVGFLFYKFKQIFTISLGGLTGYFCSMMLYNFILRYIKSNPDVVYWVTLVVCVGLGILVAIYLEKHLIITSTALLGGYATVRGASLVIGGFPPESEVIDLIRKGEFYQLSLVST